MSLSTSSVVRDDIVVLFPGQGSLVSGAGLGWRSSTHWSQIERISEISAIDVEYLLTTAPSDELIPTDRAQIATFALSTLSYLELLDHGVRARFLLGHSLGEFSALVASGLLSIAEGARLITVRGAAMRRAADATGGSMVALMGASDGARSALDALDEVWVANINGPDQIVVSGTTEGLSDLVARHRELGWRRASPLPVGGAFHSPLMAHAQEELDHVLATTTWGVTDATLLANVDGAVHTSAAEWRELLSRQLTSPVQFLECTLALPDTVTTSIEMAPAGVLSGLTKRIRPFEHQYAFATLAELQESAP